MGNSLFHHRRGVLLLALVGIVLGVLLAGRLPVKLYPATTKPNVGVMVPHPGFTAADFRSEYGEQIESRLSGLEDVDEVEGNYRSGRTRYRIGFGWNVDSEEGRREVETAMAALRGTLPQAARDYNVYAWRAGNPGFLAVAVYSSEVGPRQLYDIIEPVLTPSLDRVEDAESVDLVRVRDLQAEVTLQPDRLLAADLDLGEVVQAVEQGYQPISLGSVRDGSESTNVRVKQNVPSVFDITDIVVSSRGASETRLDDIAEVVVRWGLPRQLFRANGERSVLLFATPKEGGNVREMSNDVRAAVEQADLPEHVAFDFLVDPAAFIDNAVQGVTRSALLGALLALCAIVLLLGEGRNSFIIALSIPLTIVLTFILMYLFEISINLISLGGLTVSVGMIIDSTVVVMENIHRHRWEREPRDRASYRQAIVAAVREVRGAVIAAVTTSVLVFLPLSFTAPLTNAILGNLAKTVVLALAWSLVVSLTVVPIIAYYLFRRDIDLGRPKSNRGLVRVSEIVLRVLRGGYLWLLRALLSRRLAVWAFIVVSFGGLGALFFSVAPGIPQEILAKPQSDRVVLWFRNARSADQEELLERSAPFEERIRDGFPELVESTFTQINNETSGTMIIKARSAASVPRLEQFLRESFQSDDQWRFQVFPWDPAELPLPRTFDFHVRIEGPDPVEAAEVAERTADALREAELYGNVFADPGGGSHAELVLRPRRSVIAGFPELSLQRLTGTARTALSSARAIEMSHEGETVRVRVRYPERYIAELGGIENLLIPYDGGALPLRHFFDFSEERGVAEIASTDGEQRFSVYGFLPPGSSDPERERLETEAARYLREQVELPVGYRLVVEDTRTEIRESIQSLFIALAASVALIYLVLGFQFNSLRIPLVILATIPLGFIGVIASLALFGSTISLNSMLGTILLGGIVVNNAILLIDFYFQHRGRFTTTREALLYAAQLRFAPILITMSTTVLGMIPIALALTEGTGILQPLGVAVSGGLLVSTLFTLFMIPALLTLIHPEQVTENDEVKGSA